MFVEQPLASPGSANYFVIRFNGYQIQHVLTCLSRICRERHLRTLEANVLEKFIWGPSAAFLRYARSCLVALIIIAVLRNNKLIHKINFLHNFGHCKYYTL